MGVAWSTKCSSVYASAHGIDFLVLIRIEQMRHSSRQLCSQESFLLHYDTVRAHETPEQLSLLYSFTSHIWLLSNSLVRKTIDFARTQRKLSLCRKWTGHIFIVCILFVENIRKHVSLFRTIWQLFRIVTLETHHCTIHSVTKYLSRPSCLISEAKGNIWLLFLS